MASHDPRPSGIYAQVFATRDGRWHWQLRELDADPSRGFLVLAGGVKRTKGGAERKAEDETRAILARRAAQRGVSGRNQWEVWA